MSHRSPGRSLRPPAPPPLPLPLLLLLPLLLQLPWAAALEPTSTGVYYVTAYWLPDSKTVEIKNVLDKNGDAYGYYNDSIETTGWGILEIKAGYGSQTLRNSIIMFLAGYLEGYLTALHMYDHFTNLYPQLIKDPSIMDKVKNFMDKQDAWTRKNIKERTDDPFWRHTGYIMAQLDGLYVGALKRSTEENVKPLTMSQVQFLNAVGDLLDLIPSLSPTKDDSMKVFKRWDMGHCSALIKVLPGFEDIYFAHSSWYTYAAMLRIYKHWDFSIKDKDTKSSRHSFSSYPGFLESLDDFYILSSGLILLQTTNSVYNKTLLKFVEPETLLAWQRVRVANMMADGGKDWAEIFSKHNSGTYNNQYMVLDLKKVHIKKRLDEGTLYIVEQIPTYVEYSEQTNVLRKDYKEDPYSKGDPCNTICCREDLNEASPSPGGCYDTKVADIFLAFQYTAYAISGPTVQDGLPAFDWKRFNKTLHEGMPDVFNFDFVTMKPILTEDIK
nr:phospholipase B-like 1 isoform X2 [Peromyscus maniculatus bairdii]